MGLHAYDPKGDSPDNLVINEIHNTTNATARCFVADSGLFYTDTVVLRKQTDTAPLVVGVDYEFYGFDPESTFLTGLESACAIILKDDTITGNLVWRYQAVGGPTAEKTALVEDLRRRLLNLENGTVTWNDIKDKPLLYPAAPHLHDLLTDISNGSALASYGRQILDALVSSRVPVLAGVNLNAKIDRVFAVMGYLRKEFNAMALMLNDSKSLVVQLTGSNFTPESESVYFNAWSLVAPVVQLYKEITWDSNNDALRFNSLGVYRVTTTVIVNFGNATFADPTVIGKLQFGAAINSPSGAGLDVSAVVYNSALDANTATFTFEHILSITDLVNQNHKPNFTLVMIHPSYPDVGLTATVVGAKL